MNIFEQLQQEQAKRIVVNQTLKVRLQQELFAAVPVRPTTLQRWLSVLRSPLFVTVTTSTLALAVVASLMITPTHSVSAEAMLRIATEHMIPDLQSGQVFHVRTEQHDRADQVDRTVALWYDGKNIRTETTDAKGERIVQLDLLAPDGYIYNRYEYRSTENKITQYTAPDLRLMEQADPAAVPPFINGVTFMTDPEVNEILFGNDYVGQFIAQSNNDQTEEFCAPMALDQNEPSDFLHPVQNTKIDFAGSETIAGTTYIKIRMVTYQNDDVTDIRLTRNYHEFWLDQATGRMRQQREVIHDEVRAVTYYSAGEVLQPQPDYFTLEQWLQDYNIASLPIENITSEEQLDSWDMMLMLEAQ